MRPLQSLQHQATTLPLPVMMRHVRTYADKIVKVPQMAESISEGTLKQWSKQVGDFVEQDEEIATIETDKVRHPPSRPTAHAYIAATSATSLRAASRSLNNYPTDCVVL